MKNFRKNLTKEGVYGVIEYSISQIADISKYCDEYVARNDEEKLSPESIKKVHDRIKSMSLMQDEYTYKLKRYMEFCNPQDLRAFLERRSKRYKDDKFQLKATNEAIRMMNGVKFKSKREINR